MEGEKSSGGGVITGVIILIVVVLVAWIAYSQGIFKGNQEAGDNGVKIEVGGSGSNPSGY